MKVKRLLNTGLATGLLLALLAGLALAHEPASTPLGTGFTYQGQLTSGGTPYTGTCDFIFRLFDALSGGAQLGSLTKANVPLDDGFFAVELDYGGGTFYGDARWLEMSVRCPAGAGNYTLLSPRQALTAAPAALSLVVPLSAQGATAGPLISLANSGTGDGLDVGSAGDDGIQVTSASADGVHVVSAGHTGVYVGMAAWDGAYVSSAGGAGLRVHSAATNGVLVDSVGSPSGSIPSELKNGFQVAAVQGNGLRVGRADADGVSVASAGLDGVRVGEAGDTGLDVNTASSRGVYIWEAGDDGVYVDHAGSPSETVPSQYHGNGFRVDGAESDGLYVGRADRIGVWVDKAFDGMVVAKADNLGMVVSSAGAMALYGHTTQANHEWGFYTPDKIFAGSAQAAGGPMLIVAQNGAEAALEPGDVVSVGGAGVPFAGGDVPVPLVRMASPGRAVAGVVYARFIAQEGDDQAQPNIGVRGRSTDGPAAPGEYLLLVVLGVAQVKVDGGTTGIAAGDLLAVGTGGRAVVLGASSYVPGCLVGTAMEALDQALGGGTIWVLVSPR